MLAVYQRELLQVLNAFHPGLFNFCQVIFIVQTFQNLLMTCFGFSIFLFEVMQDITYTHTVTANLISISRADTFTRRAYFSITFRSFVSGVQYAVGRQDEMRFLRDMQARFQVMTGCFQCFSLCFRRHRMLRFCFIDCIHESLVFYLLYSHLCGILLRFFLGISRTCSGWKPFDANFCLEYGVAVVVEELLNQLKGNLHLILLAPFDELGLEVDFLARHLVKVNVVLEDFLFHELFATFVALVQIDGSDKCFESIAVHVAVV